MFSNGNNYQNAEDLLPEAQEKSHRARQTEAAITRQHAWFR